MRNVIARGLFAGLLLAACSSYDAAQEASTQSAPEQAAAVEAKQTISKAITVYKTPT